MIVVMCLLVASSSSPYRSSIFVGVPKLQMEENCLAWRSVQIQILSFFVPRSQCSFCLDERRAFLYFLLRVVFLGPPSRNANEEADVHVSIRGVLLRRPRLPLWEMGIFLNGHPWTQALSGPAADARRWLDSCCSQSFCRDALVTLFDLRSSNRMPEACEDGVSAIV